MGEQEKGDEDKKSVDVESQLGGYLGNALVKGVKEALGIESLDAMDSELFSMIFGGMGNMGQDDEDTEEDEDSENDDDDSDDDDSDDDDGDDDEEE